MVVGSDRIASQKALNALRSSHSYPLRQLEVSVTSEGIVISGQVATYYDKQQAQEIVRAAVRDFPFINRVDVQ